MYRWSVYQNILDRAQKATRARYVVLARYDQAQDRVSVVGMSGLESPLFLRSLEIVRRRLPKFDILTISFRASINPLSRQVYHQRLTAEAPTRDLARGTVNKLIIEAGVALLGMAHGVVHPLVVDDHVVGSLGYYRRTPFTEAQRADGQAFAVQAALAWQHYDQALRLNSDIRELEVQQAALLSSDPILHPGRARAGETTYGPLRLDLEERVARMEGEPLQLTRLEFDLLAHFVAHREMPLSRNELAREFWGRDDAIAADYVDIAVANLRRKTGGHIIRSLRGRRYMLKRG